MRVALIHDWLTVIRGGEKVLDLLCEIFPSADVYAVVHVPGSTTPRLEKRKVRSSWLSRLPQVGGYYRYLIPVMPYVASGMELRGYDLAVAVSHSVAHGVRVQPPTRFVCYCNSPMRYVWETCGISFPRTRRLDPRLLALCAARPFLRRWDRRAASRVGEYIANSQNVAHRIERFYRRSADAVIYPPVDTDFYRPLGVAPDDFYLWVGALAPYKRIDLAIEAFRMLRLPLVVIGDGQDYKLARRSAPSNIRFMGWQPDEVVRRYYSACRALIFPGEEDFGIVPLEAQACGRPVIAFGRGGALETVVDLDASPRDGATGIFFHEPTAESLVEAVERFERVAAQFDPDKIRRHALRFSRQACMSALAAYLNASGSGGIPWGRADVC